MKTKAVIVDMDGTLASDGWRVSMIADEGWESYMEAQVFDAPVPAVVRSVDHFFSLGYHVIILTNRWEKHRLLAEDWLEHHGVRYSELLMRPDDDYREGVEMKAHQYKTHIEPKYLVVVALEDKPEVCEMWGRMSVPAHKVTDPNLPPLV